MTAASAFLDRILPIVRARLPASVDTAYLDDFLARNRGQLEGLIAAQLGDFLQEEPAAVLPDIPEHWTASKRTAANIAAMATAANLYAQKRAPNPEERAILAGYSGWGGLSIQAAAGKFPAGFPAPEERGLVHQRVRYRNFRRTGQPAADRPWSWVAQARLRPLHPKFRARRVATRPTLGRPQPAPGSPPRGSRCPP